MQTAEWARHLYDPDPDGRRCLPHPGAIRAGVPEAGAEADRLSDRAVRHRRWWSSASWPRCSPKQSAEQPQGAVNIARRGSRRSPRPSSSVGWARCLPIAVAQIGSFAVRTVVAVLTVIAGTGQSSACRRYTLPTQPAWNVWHPVQFFTTALLLGSLAVGAALVANTPTSAAAASPA